VLAPSVTLHAAGGGSEHLPLAARWSVDPRVLTAMALSATLFVIGWRRLRSRGRPDLAGYGRMALFAAGMAVVVLAIFSPLDPMGEEYLLSAHMLQHVLLGDVGPLLLVMAMSGTLALFAVPRPVLRTVGRNRPARAVLRVLGKPSTAVVVWVAVTAGWHIPVFYEYALANRWAHDLEHATMFGAGVLIWIAIIGAVPRTRMSRARRAVLAVSILGIGMVISQVLFLADPLYSVYIEQPERLFGLSPKADQVQAALLMSAEQILTFGTAAGLLLIAHVERVGPASRAEAEVAPDQVG
jgi:putative membrane protein